ncbi:hypothetical protein TNCV_4434351 [Trichonephila clavipes]|nr:hypothetical protein TNCV_4434351 [Trichonephila clavipes]
MLYVDEKRHFQVLRRYTQTVALRKYLCLDEISNSFRLIAKNDSDGGKQYCSNLDSDEDIRFSESDGQKSEESADVSDNISLNSDIYVARDGTDWIMHISNVTGRFATRNVLQQSSGPTYMK